MFSFRDFIRKGFLAAVGKMATHQIILNAGGYYEKGVLTAEDLEQISAAIVAAEATERTEDTEQSGDE